MDTGWSERSEERAGKDQGMPLEKNRQRRWMRLWILVFCLPFLVGSCTWWAKPEPPSTPQYSFERAMTLYNQKKYEKAAEAFRRFKEEFPLNTYA
ncbi:MAG: hypothetical protein NTY64_04955, partial [Deltaproteobacteria bacterium]|nr:hypothetical protein [Deltaproteobacteria bacterium]